MNTEHISYRLGRLIDAIQVYLDAETPEALGSLEYALDNARAAISTETQGIVVPKAPYPQGLGS